MDRAMSPPDLDRPWDRTPPLLAECIREGRNPIGELRNRIVLGWVIIVVPLRLLPYRGAARVMIGTILARRAKPEDVHDLRVRTIDGEPSWIFAIRPKHMPRRAAAIRRRGWAA